MRALCEKYDLKLSQQLNLVKSSQPISHIKW